MSAARNCPHHAGWSRGADGAWRCDRCGTRRFDDYGALRPPGLPETIKPSPAALPARDRAAARFVAERLPRGIRWGRKEADLPRPSWSPLRRRTCRAAPAARFAT
ncbi:DUF6255 family natural product biosynthesis protein [Streptomyces sp. NPDC053048]|uniref:DUF6255 family natural product biosynthesis protein n=1 Tax=Streptomyces sp. NPDC053048 TaxID=3365694 RepID=UPI0037CD4092